MLPEVTIITYKNVSQMHILDTSSFHEGGQQVSCVVTKDNNLNQVMEQMTVRVQRIQSDLWKRICRISLPLIEKLNPT